jgi:TRAP-type C4-dicarboxylate transport system substrate-binding protein
MFPWGSVPLLGVDKVTKYDMDAAISTTTFQWVMNQKTYDAMSPTQKKAIDDHCTTEWAGKFADPWGDFEHAGLAKVKALPGREVYQITNDQLDEWKSAVSRCARCGPTRPKPVVTPTRSRRAQDRLIIQASY